VSNKELDDKTELYYAERVLRSTPALQVEAADAQQLRQWVSAFGTPQQVALRSRIVLAAAAGQSDNAIARGLAVNRKTVTLWRERFAQEGLDSMWEVAPGRGRKPSYGQRKIAAIVSATLTTKPKGMTQWSCRQLAEAQGVSKSTVHNIWQRWPTGRVRCDAQRCRARETSQCIKARVR